MLAPLPETVELGVFTPGHNLQPFALLVLPDKDTGRITRACAHLHLVPAFGTQLGPHRVMGFGSLANRFPALFEQGGSNVLVGSAQCHLGDDLGLRSEGKAAQEQQYRWQEEFRVHGAAAEL